MAKAATAPAGGFFANWRQNIIYIGFDDVTAPRRHLCAKVGL